MRNVPPFTGGQDSSLPSQNKPSVKDLELMEVRIARALALQVWRLSRCRHYAVQDRFVERFNQLIEHQDQVVTWLNCEPVKLVA